MSFLLAAPGLHNLPTAFKNIVQDGILVREFNDSLYPNLRYRAMFEPFYPNASLGQSFTFSQAGLLADADLPITPPSNTDLDSGMAVSNPTDVEQFTVKLNKYGKQVDTNMLTSSLSIENLYVKNSHDLGRNAGRSLDKASRHHTFAAYGGFRTHVTAAAGPVTTISVNNAFGFDFVMKDGVPTPVANVAGQKRQITINGTTTVNVVAVASAVFNGNTDTMAADLTTDAPVTVVVGDVVVATEGAGPTLTNADPPNLRPNGKSTSHQLLATDTMVLKNLMDLEAILEDLSVPPHADGFYYGIFGPTMLSKIYSDTAFTQVTETLFQEDIYARQAIGYVSNILLFKTPLVPRGTNAAGVSFQRGIICGGELGYEARYADIDKLLAPARMNPLGMMQFSEASWIALLHRGPLDSHMEVIRSSWKFLGGWALRTDSLVTDIRPSTYKRAAVLEAAA